MTVSPPESLDDPVEAGGRRSRSNTGLEVSGLSVRYGGIAAVDDVSLTTPVGRITGLIGPNGAGKTTIFGACSGLVRPAAGRVYLFDEDVTHLAVPARARRGLGRTFQRLELFDSLSTEENVRLCCEAHLAGRNVVKQFRSARYERQLITRATEEALEQCGLGPIRRTAVGLLSTGQRRLVDLARVLAAGFRLLLLDEPSSGLDTSETESFGDILEGVVAASGCGVLLVEHDMRLVTRLCQHIYVLDFGRLIFEGSARDVLDNPAVRAAYLGEGVA